MLAASLFAAGCAGETGPVGHITFAGHEGTEFRVTPDGISNERVNVSRVDKTKTFRGIITSGAKTFELELRAEGEFVKGERGGTPVDLHIEQKSPTDTVVHGMYGGQLVSFHLMNEPAVQCAFRYDEAEQDKQVTCETEPAAMAVPTAITSLPVDEKAILYAVAFGEVTRIKNPNIR